MEVIHRLKHTYDNPGEARLQIIDGTVRALNGDAVILKGFEDHTKVRVVSEEQYLLFCSIVCDYQSLSYLQTIA